MKKSVRVLEYVRLASAGGIVFAALASLIFNGTDVFVVRELSLAHLAAIVGAVASVIAVKIAHFEV